MFSVNKIISACLNPLSFGLAMALIGCFCAWRKFRRLGMCLTAASVLWLWLWSAPATYRLLGCVMESEWPVVKAEDAPEADAIVVLGGGMGSNTNAYSYAEMWGGADRVWHAARLYKAGKAPIVIPSGSGERESTLPLLMDLGVPEEAILVEDKARNTEENAKFVLRILKERLKQDANIAKGKCRVLLVTPSWHMKRAMMMYNKYAPELKIFL